MTTSLEYFRLIAPEFSVELDATVNIYIGMAASFINASAYVNPELALAYQAASLMLASKNSAIGVTGGALISEKEGDLERKFSAPKKGESTDIYMAQLLRLGSATGLGSCAVLTRMFDVIAPI